MPGEIWKLYARDELVAELVVKDGDFPWLYADLKPLPGFEPFRSELERRSGGTLADGQLHMVAPDGDRITEFLLRVDGDTAWWRWNEPEG